MALLFYGDDELTELRPASGVRALKVLGEWDQEVTVRLRLKSKRCGDKSCGECPHGPYAYVVAELGRGRRLEKCLGRVRAPDPPARGKVRDRKGAWGAALR